MNNDWKWGDIVCFYVNKYACARCGRYAFSMPMVFNPHNWIVANYWRCRCGCATVEDDGPGRVIGRKSKRFDETMKQCRRSLDSGQITCEDIERNVEIRLWN